MWTQVMAKEGMMAMNQMGDGTRLIAMVQEGMEVRDAAGERVGKVRSVFVGDGGDPADADRQAREAIANVQRATSEPDDKPLGIGDIEAVGVGGLSGDGGHPLGPLTGAAAIDPDYPNRVVAEGPLGAQVPDEDLPREGRDALVRQGYIRIDSAGLFAADMYATADQVAQVGADGVVLSVGRDALRSAR
jgi:hypothetical protein